MTNFTHAKYGPDTVRIDDPTYVVPLLTEDVTVGTGLAFPAADTVAIEAGGVEKARFTSTLNSLAGVTTLLANSASAALTVTQTGAGDAFVVEDSASTDSTPFVIDANGNVAIGLTSPSGNKLLVADETSIGYVGRSTGSGGSPITLQRQNTSLAAPSIVASGNVLGQLQFAGYDGSAYIQAANIIGTVDGTPGTNDMPGRLVFSTTADGASSPTEALRIDSTQSVTNTAAGSGTNAYGFRVTSAKTGGTNNYAFSGEIAAGANRYNFYAAGTADNYFAGSVGVGGVPATGYKLLNYGNYTGSTTFYATATQGTVQSDVTVFAVGYRSALNTAAAAFTLSSLFHYIAEQGTVGAGSTVTSQHGFNASAGLIGASNNYGFSAGNTAAVLTGKVAIGFYSAVNTATGGGTTWGFYGNGTANNAYAGNSSFGKVTAPTSAVDTTSFAVGFATNSGATCTVGSTDHTIVQTTTASTYTLPAASSFPGRILKLLTQFAGAVVSASSNVVPIAGGAAGTAILAATAGKYAVLQSTGTNWQITEAN